MFLHQPEAGLAVPVVLNFKTKSLHVGMPSVAELAQEYAVFDAFDDAVRAAGAGRGNLMKAARRFSRAFTTLFSSEIETGDLTVAGLRELVVRHVRQRDPARIMSDGSEIEIVDFRKAFTSGRTLAAN